MEIIVEEDNIEEMITITAGYAKLGVMFECRKLMNGNWLIKLTGGF